MKKATKILNESLADLSPLEILMERLGALRGLARTPLLSVSSRFGDLGLAAAAPAKNPLVSTKATLQGRTIFNDTAAAPKNARAATLLATSALAAPRAVTPALARAFTGVNNNNAPLALALAPAAALAPALVSAQSAKTSTSYDAILRATAPEAWQSRQGALLGAFGTRSRGTLATTQNNARPHYNGQTRAANNNGNILPLMALGGAFGSHAAPAAPAPVESGGGNWLGLGFGAAAAGFVLPRAWDALTNGQGLGNFNLAGLNLTNLGLDNLGLDNLGLDNLGGLADSLQDNPLFKQTLDFAQSSTGGGAGMSFAPS